MEMTNSSDRDGKKKSSGFQGDMELCLNYVFLPDEELVLKSKDDDWTLLDEKEDEEVKWVLTACWISIGAILGSLLRIVIAQLFGDACANPESVGWLSAGAPLCVTKDGNTQQQGGIVFADLPSNLLGCFIIGLLQNSAVLELAVPMSIAWLVPFHPFQRATVIHTALKTGFCGSLTTFSSWNSEMVVMLFGTDRSLHSQIWSALFGYIIGMETSVGSYACGCSLAKRLHKWRNPALAEEMVAANIKREEGVYINKDLPDLERRFLPGLNMQSQDFYVPERMENLLQWRDSTAQVRRIGHPLLPILIQVENTILVMRTPLDPSVETVVRKNGWALDRLLDYADSKSCDLDALPRVSSSVSMGNQNAWDTKDMWWFKLPIAASVLSIGMILLFMALIFVSGDDPASITYRTMCYSMLLAPSGALLRWYLSAWNGTSDFLPKDWKWLPFGTFSANIFGSVVSILMISLEYRLGNQISNSSSSTIAFWKLGTIRAIKVGFAGCLTTVSTFVSEIRAFMHSKTDHAYPYIFVTLMTSCLCTSIVYGFVLVV